MLHTNRSVLDGRELPIIIFIAQVTEPVSRWCCCLWLSDYKYTTKFVGRHSRHNPLNHRKKQMCLERLIRFWIHFLAVTYSVRHFLTLVDFHGTFSLCLTNQNIVYIGIMVMRAANFVNMEPFIDCWKNDCHTVTVAFRLDEHQFRKWAIHQPAEACTFYTLQTVLNHNAISNEPYAFLQIIIRMQITNVVTISSY